MISKTLDGWKFVSELVLEKLVWANLKELFDIIPFKQQYNCNGEISDILAIDDHKRLVIIELKNVEDRYIIQQLTRYYANLLEEKPFSEEIDYSLPARLIAITPEYHRHNLIDREHSRLNFEFFQFSITSSNLSFDLILEELGQEGIQKKCSIPYQPLEILAPENIPDIPEVLISWLGSCNKEEQDIFLKVRNLILTSHEKIGEIIDKKIIQYGSNKSKLCAEICYESKIGKPILFLWLPLPSVCGVNLEQEIPKFGRMRIWIDGSRISHLAHIPKGFGHMKTWDEWELIPREKRPKNIHWSYSSESYIPVHIENYLRTKGNLEELDICNYLTTLVIQYLLARR
jgi:RecB family endonuclease NucS